jgi:hypothetical protein
VPAPPSLSPSDDLSIRLFWPFDFTSMICPLSGAMPSANYYLVSLGRAPEANAQTRLALERDSLSMPVYVVVCRVAPIDAFRWVIT